MNLSRRRPGEGGTCREIHRLSRAAGRAFSQTELGKGGSLLENLCRFRSPTSARSRIFIAPHKKSRPAPLGTASDRALPSMSLLAELRAISYHGGYKDCALPEPGSGEQLGFSTNSLVLIVPKHGQEFSLATVFRSSERFRLKCLSPNPLHYYPGKSMNFARIPPSPGLRRDRFMRLYLFGCGFAAL